MSARDNRGIRPTIVGLTIVFVAGVLIGTSAGIAKAQETARQPVPQSVGSLGVGDTLFWDGGYVEQSVGTNFGYALWAYGDHEVQPETCNAPEECWAYELEVTEKAEGLRVWIDMNRRSECVWVELWAPGTYGDPDADRTKLSEVSCPDLLVTHFPMLWTLEAYEDDPLPGTWVVRVVPIRVQNWAFRMRATLEGAPEGGTKALLPDLKTLPPHDFGFEAPINPGAGIASDNTNPPGRVVSCTPDEIEEANRETGSAPLRCLRLSAGIYNVGEGFLDLRLRPTRVPEEGKVYFEGHIIQLIRDGDGTVVEQQEAGTWTAGGTHLHDHVEGFADFELFRVLEVPSHPDKREDQYLERAGSGHKLGWQDQDQRLHDWYRFDPAVQLQGFKHCRDVEKESCVVVSPGWGDHYRWSRPGMYVDFPLDVAGSTDGDYLVRMFVDHNNDIAESDERNNVSYAWIRVVGDQVTICERGQGVSPWDPRKEIHEPSFWLSTPGGTTTDSPTGDCS